MKCKRKVEGEKAYHILIKRETSASIKIEIINLKQHNRDMLILLNLVMIICVTSLHTG